MLQLLYIQFVVVGFLFHCKVLNMTLAVTLVFVFLVMVAILVQVLLTLAVTLRFVFVFYGQFLTTVDMLIIVFVQGLFQWIIYAVLSSWWLSWWPL